MSWSVDNYVCKERKTKKSKSRRWSRQSIYTKDLYSPSSILIVKWWLSIEYILKSETILLNMVDIAVDRRHILRINMVKVEGIQWSKWLTMVEASVNSCSGLGPGLMMTRWDGQCWEYTSFTTRAREFNFIDSPWLWFKGLPIDGGSRCGWWFKLPLKKASKCIKGHR